MSKPSRLFDPMFPNLARLTGALFLVVLLTQLLAAQTEIAPKRGVYLNASYSLSEFETINNTNGNVMFNFPLASLPAGRGGMNYGIGLGYNSKQLDVVTDDYFVPPPGYQGITMKTKKSTTGGGWQYRVGYRLEQKKRPNVNEFSGNIQDNCYSPANPNYAYFDMYKFILTLPDGSQKEFAPVMNFVDQGGTYSSDNQDGYYAVDLNGKYRFFHDIHDLTGAWQGCEIQYAQHTGGMSFYSTDGSFLRLDVTHDNDTDWSNNFWTLRMPDGSRITQNEPLSGGGTAQQRIYDRNNNYVEIQKQNPDINTETVQVTDQLGRSLNINKNLQTLVDTVTLNGLNNTPLSWTVKWKNVSVSRQYWNSEDRMTFPNPAVAGHTFKVVDEIVLPTQLGGLSYKFTYLNTADSSYGFGEVSKVELPSGATVEYQYKLDGTASTGIPLWKDVYFNPLISKKLTYQISYDGQTTTKIENWIYDITRTQSTITTPDGGVSKIFYKDIFIDGAGFAENGGIVTSSQSPDGTINRKEYVEYTGSALLWNKAWTNLGGFETTTLPDNQGNPSLAAIKKSDYDLNGNLVRISEYDWVPSSSISYNSAGLLIVPSGAVLKRVTENSYYNGTPEIVPNSNPTQIYPNEYRSGSSPRILNALKASEVRTGSGTVMARSEFFYDDLVNKGNLTQTKVWDSTKGALAAPDANGFRLNVANSISTATAYDLNGSPTLVTDASGVQTALTYGAITTPTGSVSNLYPTKIETAANFAALKRTATMEYDFATGLVTKSTDLDNNVSNETVYDALGRPLISKAATGTPQEVWTQTEYHDAERYVVARSDLNTKGDGAKVVVQHYDQLGRVRLSRTLENAATQSAANESDGIKVQTRYLTTAGYNYTLSSNPYRAATSAAAGGEATMGWTRSLSTSTGKHAEVETFAGAGVPAPFASSGGNTASTGKVLTDRDADRVLVTDQAGKQRISQSNALGQLTNVWEVKASDSSTVTLAFPNHSEVVAGYLTSYSYDTLNNLLTVNQNSTAGNQQRNFAYSSLSRLTSAANPESGLISYTYDSNGNLLTKTDARWVKTSYVYDQLNRVTARNYSIATGHSAPANYLAAPNVNYYYDGIYFNSAGSQQTATGAVKGKLTSVKTAFLPNPSYSNYTAFDLVGRVKSSQQITDAVTYTFSDYSYNLAGALISETYPSLRQVRNTYDADGDLAAVASRTKATNPLRTYASNFSYTAHGAVAAMQLGNTRWETTTFNNRLQPVQLGLGTTNSTTAPDLWKATFDYGMSDNNGNVKSQTITVPSVTIGSTTYPGFNAFQAYTYDSLNRLQSANEVINAATTWKQTFTFDRFGNRRFDAANTTMPASCTTAACNPAADPFSNKFAAGQGYSYDAAGNLAQDAAFKKFTYDSENKQSKVETVDGSGNVTGQPGSYVYDGDGKRIKKVTTAETTIFVYDASGKMVAEYSTTPPPPPAQATTSYLTNDHLGSPRVITDSAGKVTSRRDFLPFGEDLSTPQRTIQLGYAADTIRQKFTGYQKDEESGLDFAKARMYGGSFGRFTSPDPLAASAKLIIPQSWNRYTYVLNNPLNLVDPSGMIWGTRTYTRGNKEITEWQWFPGKKVGKGWSEYKGSSVVSTTSHGVINLNSDGSITRLGVPGTGRMSKADEKNNEDWMAITNATGGLLCSGSAGFVCPGDNNASEFKDAKMGADAVQYAFIVKSLLKAGLSLAAIAAIIKKDPEDIAKIAAKVIGQGWKNKECLECVNALIKEFKAAGIQGIRRELTGNGGAIVRAGQNTGEAVADAGAQHYGVQVGEMIYEMNSTKGIPINEWASLYESINGVTLVPVP